MAAANGSYLSLQRRAPQSLAFMANSEQRKVIAHAGSPLSIFGGAGTGKTSTLIECVLARISDGVDPNSILILAYGRERADYLRDRIALRAESTSPEPLARTFHSLAFSILNEKLRPEDPRFVLISGAEQDAFIKSMLESGFDKSPWHPELQLARASRGFVREIRDLILRATELNLKPKELIELGETLAEKYWKGAAHFWSSYHGAMELSHGTVGEGLIRIDPSAIIIEAIARLEADATLLNLYRSRFSTILVDEFQESDLSQRKLLTLLAGSDLLLFADPLCTVGRFRGADPDGVTSFMKQIAPTRMDLNTSFRRPTTEIAKVAGASELANYIAYSFRSAHLHDGLAWSKMAVLLRSPGVDVSAISRAFALHGIPLSVDAQALALADNPALRPILALARFALLPVGLTSSAWEQIEALLLSEFGGADALSIRRMRAQFVKVRSDEDHRSSTSMIIDALTSPTCELAWDEILPIKRVHDLLLAAKKSLRQSRSISDLLWAIWSNAKNYQGESIPQLWRDRALRGGARGAQADRDLDSMMQLFESARRFAERSHDGDPLLFIDQLMGERILSDSITSLAQRENVVSLLTIHSAKGLEWDLVALVGMQEGSWPNLKERGSLLGSDRLVEAHRTGLTSRSEINAAAALALLLDERRLLHVGRTRARIKTIILAVQNDGSQPSQFFEEIYEEIHGVNSDEAPPVTPGRALTPQALVAQLRRDLEEPAKAEFAGKLLKNLANVNFPGADSSRWLGMLAQSTDLPIVDPREQVRISPSSLQTFEDCGLKWFLEKSGSRDGDSVAQLLGIAIHALAALVMKEPELSAADAIERLTNSWTIVDQNVGWYKAAQLQSASQMLARFFEWKSGNSRELIAVEAHFAVEIGRGILSGSVDRLEQDAAGALHIVDLKTGKAVPTKKEVAEHRQLAAYQLAIMKAGFEKVSESTISGGAELLMLAKSSEAKSQAPVDFDLVYHEIETAAEGMSSATFVATINKQCRNCAVKGICPLQAEGRSVIDQ